MSVDRTEGRRRNQRAFRPTLDGQVALEPRRLMSKLPGPVFLKHPQPGVAYVHNQPPFLSGTHAEEFPVAHFPHGTQIATETAHGGASVVVAAQDGSRFLITITQFFQTAGSSTTGGTTTGSQLPIQGQIAGGGVIQPIGTVRAYSMPGGKVGLIVDGTTNESELDINPLGFRQRKGYAHSFAYGESAKSHILNVGQITVNSGVISAINGYHTANLSGPLTVSGNQPVDRISFNALLPGASIVTGGDLNTLDVLNGITLNTAPGILVGRDLNLINVGQDVNLSNGASIFAGRFFGATLQPPKGTATGSNFLSQNQALVGTGTSTLVSSLAGYIQGNISLGTGSTLTALDGIAKSSLTANALGQPVASSAIFLINGRFTANSLSQIGIPNAILSTNLGNNANIVARSGFDIPFINVP